MFKPILARAVPVLALAAIAAGCGGAYGSDGKPAAAKSTPAAENAAETGGAISDTNAGPVVTMRGSTFQPAEIKAKVGETVTFDNNDQIAHTVTATAGAKFDSGTLDAGKTYSWTPKKAGTVSFVCNFHPGMTGTIEVS